MTTASDVMYVAGERLAPAEVEAVLIAPPGALDVVRAAVDGSITAGAVPHTAAE